MKILAAIVFRLLLAGHSGRLANDGNPNTFWQAAAGDTNAWLEVDLERLITVNQTKLAFPTAGNWRYKIEISDDGGSGWKLLADQTQTASDSKVRADEAPSHSRGRFLRVTVTGAPLGTSAALAEVEVRGTLNAP